MFDCVPDPVCHTTNGKLSSSFPSSTSSQAFAINAVLSSGKSVSSLLVNAAAFFKYANALIISMGIEAGSPI